MSPAGYPPGSKLPSVRELAADAGVNPNTVQRAFADLERAGLIYTQRTAGKFVTEDAAAVAAARRSLAEAQTRSISRPCARLAAESRKFTIYSIKWRNRNMPIFECRALEKRYGAAMALDHIDLALEPGRIVGLLGPNGSGKSTLIKLAMGLLQPTSGEVLIGGQAPSPQTNAVVSYLPDRHHAQPLDEDAPAA